MIITDEMLPSRQEVIDVLEYNPETGIFVWRVNRNPSCCAGDRAGSLASNKRYRQVRVGGRNFREHRIAWLYMTGKWPCAEIDHINHCKTDNRFSNLREATHSQNLTYAGPKAHNKSGYKGVYWHKARAKFCAQIRHNKQTFSLGYFHTAEAASAAYAKAATQLHGEFKGFLTRDGAARVQALDPR